MSKKIVAYITIFESAEIKNNSTEINEQKNRKQNRSTSQN